MQATSNALELLSDSGPRPGATPEAGQVVWLRNRLARVEQVRRFGTARTRVSHLVTVVFLDRDAPRRAWVLWELERVAAGRLEPLAAAAQRPVDPQLLAGWLRANRWQNRHPLPDLPDTRQLPDWWHRGAGPLLSVITSRFEPEEYQLVPLETALKMPRVRVLLADEVGMGKTLEAGLIASELTLRRRIRRMLVLCPPALMDQWRHELQSRFGLSSAKLERGAADLSAHRLVASYHYLKRKPVLERFLKSCTTPVQGRLPWDLLIVDEAHNLAPGPCGPESQLTSMLRQVSRWFEHRIFITATPHDGYSSSLTGLLEMLDPVQFRRTALPTAPERERMEEAVIRQSRPPSKTQGTDDHDSRSITTVPITFRGEEQALFDRYKAFKHDLACWGGIPTDNKRESLVFAIQSLGKRLLSSIPAFAYSFALFYDQFHGRRDGLSGRSEQTGNWRRVARLVRRWCDTRFPGTAVRIEQIRSALLELDAWPFADGLCRPRMDSRADAFVKWVRQFVLGESGNWEGAGRALVFTEFRTTQEYLERVIEDALCPEAGRVQVLHSQVDRRTRVRLLDSFRDPGSCVRLLLATDIASEGLNLQSACHQVFNFDIPWNPARMEQRAGRVDRYGQTAPVSIFHFETLEGLDLGLRHRVAGKLDVMAEDLGPVRPLLGALPDETGPVLAGPALFPGINVSSRKPCRPEQGRESPSVETGETAWQVEQLRELLWLPCTRGSGLSPADMERARRRTWLALQQCLTAGRAGRWAVTGAMLPEGLDGALRLFFRSLVLSEDGVPLHAWLGQCRIPARKVAGRWRCDVAAAGCVDEAPRIARVGDARLEQEGASLWAHCAADVRGFVRDFQAGYGRCLSAAVSQARRSETAALERRLSLRESELEALGLDSLGRRLRRHMEALAAERDNQGFLFPELLAANLIKGDEAARELAGLERQQLELKQTLAWERRRSAGALQARYSLACRPVVILEAALLEIGEF